LYILILGFFYVYYTNIQLINKNSITLCEDAEQADSGSIQDIASLASRLQKRYIN
jgi:hypothetical protein